MDGITRGISLYSFQDDYFHHRRDLEGCIAASAELGAPGIETLAEQMMPGFPDLPDTFYEQWHAWMRRYGTTPTAHDMFLDTQLYPDRLLTHEEMVASVHRDVRHAARLGASVIRVIVNTPPEVVEAAAPYARDHGVRLCVEVHAPYSFDHEWIRAHLAVADRAGLDAVGVVPDLGIFVERFPRVIWQRTLRDGGTPKLVERIVAAYDGREDLSGLPDEVAAAGGTPQDVGLARMVGHFVYTDPAVLAENVRYIAHVHAKFYEMTPDGEYSIPYPRIVRALRDAGWSGCLSSEYEGNRHVEDAQPVDSYGQLRLHQEMMAGLIATGN